ncbi:cyclodeaminase/cyclohydrolase family protein [Longispora albida]|uniref:cyclodeaminase/cyclohydrolase family protein n=1 Tax=Longispora albida TaxID=203523 RepID=UPI00036962D9|nr:cyclodeaminase/cyclohydrolase family protein [Longispora albida]
MPDQVLLRDQPVGEYAAQLADRVPAPGGGAVAALHAAQAAALLAMVARYSDQANPEVTAAVAEADELRAEGLALAEADIAAFSAVADAYKLRTPERSTAIVAALLGAAEPQVATIEAAHRLIRLAERLLPIGNKNVITDVGAGAEAARAAAVSARLNVEINRAGLPAGPDNDRLAASSGTVPALAARADLVTETVLRAVTR